MLSMCSKELEQRAMWLASMQDNALGWAEERQEQHAYLGFIAAVQDVCTCASQTVQAAADAIRRRVGLGRPLKPMLSN